MAGRGTDILLGGNPDFLAKEILRKRGLDPATAPAEARAVGAGGGAQDHRARARAASSALGGLHIVGTERHESRRIDNQLRGRSGRQGDPGSSRFYLSLEDDLLRIFGSQRIQKIMERLGMEEGEPIEHQLVTRAIATAQKRVETHNFEIRKHLLEYDDVMNKQREIIYGMRRQILDGESQAETIAEWIEESGGRGRRSVRAPRTRIPRTGTSPASSRRVPAVRLPRAAPAASRTRRRARRSTRSCWRRCASATPSASASSAPSCCARSSATRC